MKANELRIGNYVYCTLGKVNKIDLEAITYIAKEPHNQVKSIPLTEEWLLKFGFQKYKTGHNTYKIQSFIIEEGLLKDSPYCFRKRINNENSIELAYIKYIHQLQNLYFALTGEELTFKSE